MALKSCRYPPPFLLKIHLRFFYFFGRVAIWLKRTGQAPQDGIRIHFTLPKFFVLPVFFAVPQPIFWPLLCELFVAQPRDVGASQPPAYRCSTPKYCLSCSCLFWARFCKFQTKTLICIIVFTTLMCKCKSRHPRLRVSFRNPNLKLRSHNLLR